MASTPPGPSFWPAGGVRGKAKERVEGIAQPYHALVYAHQTTSPAGRARGGRYGGLTGHEGQDPPSSLPPPESRRAHARDWLDQPGHGRTRPQVMIRRARRPDEQWGCVCRPAPLNINALRMDASSIAAHESSLRSRPQPHSPPSHYLPGETQAIGGRGRARKGHPQSAITRLLRLSLASWAGGPGEKEARRQA